MFPRVVTLAVIVPFAAAVVACYGNDAADNNAAEAKICVAHAKLSSSELASPPADFAKDVVPVLVASCGSSSCHASKLAAANHGLFLKPKNDEEISLVKEGLMKSSRALSAMPYVTPNDPDQSFLMHKLDGDTCVLDKQCEGGSCGDSMPDGNDLLPEATRDVVRRWIAQGAK